MNTETNPGSQISAGLSVWIDKQLEEVKGTVDKGSSYFYSKNQAQVLLDIKTEIDCIFFGIFDRISGEQNLITT